MVLTMTPPREDRVVSERSAYMAGFKSGATEVCKETAKLLHVPLKPWNDEDELRSAFAYAKWNSAREGQE